MKIIDPSAELVTQFAPADVMKHLERCGRVSHKSEMKDADAFVRNIIKLGHESVLEHVQITFRIICDRAIQNELVRHRHASFTVESTRYVKYDELVVVKPFRTLDSEDGISFAFWHMMSIAERHYLFLIEQEFPPELARAVLPLCTATELYMTANLREWRHILKLRTSKAAHPQMRQIMSQVLATFKELLPVIVEDIKC